jgi:hypothetical protein
VRHRETVHRPRRETFEPRRTLGGSLKSGGCGAHGRGPLE